MANDKKSVLLYCDIIHTVEQLDDVDAGMLFKHYLRYINDQNPEPPSKLIQIVFEPIKQNLKRDLKKWESKSLKNKENAKMRWNANASERTNGDANYADKDTVTVKDNVIVKDKVINKYNAKSFLCSLGFDEKLIDEWFVIRKSKKLSNTETAMQGFLKEVEKTGCEKNEILRRCVENSWGGFKASWTSQNQKSESNKPILNLINSIYGNNGNQ